MANHGVCVFCLLWPCAISLCAEVKAKRYFLGSAFIFPPLSVAPTRVPGDAGVCFSPRESPWLRVRARTRVLCAVWVHAPVCFFPTCLPANAVPSQRLVVNGFPRLCGCERAYGKSNDVVSADAGRCKANCTFILYKCCCVQSNKSLALPYISKQISFTVSYKARRVWGPVLHLRRRETICKPPVLLFIKCKRAAIYCILTSDKF